MADKKTTKTIKKADEVKSIDQLREELIVKQNDLIESKRSHRLGELTNPRILGKTRKEIARLHSAITVAKRAEFANGEKENK